MQCTLFISLTYNTIIVSGYCRVKYSEIKIFNVTSINVTKYQNENILRNSLNIRALMSDGNLLRRDVF